MADKDMVQAVLEMVGTPQAERPKMRKAMEILIGALTANQRNWRRAVKRAREVVPDLTDEQVALIRTVAAAS